MSKSKFKISVKDLICWIVVMLFVFTLLGTIVQRTVSYILVIALCICPVFLGRKNIDKFYIQNYLFILSFAIYGLFTILINGGGIGGFLSILTGLIVFMGFREMTLKKKQLTVLSLTLFIVNIYWNYNSPDWYDKYFYNNWLGDGTVTNANGVGKYICYTAILFFIFTRDSKHKIVRFFRTILPAISLVGIYLVKARISLAIFVLFFTVDIFMEKKKKMAKKILRSLTIASIVLEIIFPMIYLWMYSNNIASEYRFANLAEKGLYSGRQTIWINAFNGMESLKDWMFGVGSKVDYWAGHVLNLHNNAMDLLVVVGIVGLVIYYVYLLQLILLKYNYNMASMQQHQMLLFFICILFEGMSDITIFYNDFLLYMFIPLGIAFNPSYYKYHTNKKDLRSKSDEQLSICQL